MHGILLVSSNLAARGRLATLLRLSNCEVVLAESGRAALDVAPSLELHAILIDEHLHDIASSELAEQLRQCRPNVQCFVMSDAVDAAESQSSDPAGLSGRQLTMNDALSSIQLLTTLGEGERAPSPDRAEGHPLDRWVAAVVRIIAAPGDPRTLEEWARGVAVSPATLRTWCRMVRLSPRRSLLFARVLRAIGRQHETRSDAEDLLNIVDRRTLAKLLVLSGGPANRLPPSVEDFLGTQRLIESPAAVAQISAALARIATPVDEWQSAPPTEESASGSATAAARSR